MEAYLSCIAWCKDEGKQTTSPSVALRCPMTLLWEAVSWVDDRERERALTMEKSIG